MNLSYLKAQAALGEDSRRQFRRDVTNVDSLAAETAAFANSEGGVIYSGGPAGSRHADLVRVATRELAQFLHGNLPSLAVDRRQRHVVERLSFQPQRMVQ